MSWLLHPGKSSVAVVVLALIFFGAPNAMGADQETVSEGAREFITELADETVSLLVHGDVDVTERRKRFRTLMLKYFAFKGIAKWVLGRYWRRASAAEREEYLELFEDLMVVSYADRFAKYSGDTLDVGKSEIRGEKDVLVHSVLMRAEGLKPVAIIWRMRQRDASFKIVDFMVEGLSMGLTQQKEFTSVIRKNGGKVQSLLDELKKRLAANS